MKRFDLENHPRIGTGFKTPDDFFDGFEDQVFAKIAKHDTKVISIFGKYKAVIYASAAILLLAFLIPIAINTPKSTEIDDKTIENYLAYESNINQFDILTVLDPQDIKELKAEMPVEDEAIEEYLSTSDIENIILD